MFWKIQKRFSTSRKKRVLISKKGTQMTLNCPKTTMNMTETAQSSHRLSWFCPNNTPEQTVFEPLWDGCFGIIPDSSGNPSYFSNRDLSWSCTPPIALSFVSSVPTIVSGCFGTVSGRLLTIQRCFGKIQGYFRTFQNCPRIFERVSFTIWSWSYVFRCNSGNYIWGKITFLVCSEVSLPFRLHVFLLYIPFCIPEFSC